MKKILTLLLLISGISLGNAQNSTPENFNEKVQSIDSTIKTLYSIISDGNGQERNWDLFKFLFKDDSEIILNLKDNQGQSIKFYLTVEQYINSYGKWLFKNGLYAKETARTTSSFRHMHSVSSTYEQILPNGKKGSSQVNYINLLNENNRWYISNLKWNQEVDDLKSITEYMPDSKD